jgi:uncharacterized repeat protein (TIGR01451 family)
MANRLVGAMAVVGLAFVASHESANAQFEELITSRIGIVRFAANPPLGKLYKLVSKAPKAGPLFLLPSADPATTGGSLAVGVSPESLNCTLAAQAYNGTEGWKTLGPPAAPKGYRYINKDAPGGTAGPCKIILVKEKVIKVVAKGTGGLPEPLAYGFNPHINTVLTLGEDQYCARWEAPHFKEVASKLIKAKDQLPPGACPAIPTETTLEIDKTGPPAVFAGQQFDFTITVTNAGASDAATNVVLVDDVPVEGAFVSSNPTGSLVGGQLTIDLGSIPQGGAVVVTVTWQAPESETTLINHAESSADNAGTVVDEHEVEVGIQTVATGGVTAAGTGLRNRDNGEIAITGVPAGAVVTRAVLTWAVLYTSPVPSDQVTFEGTLITADLTQTVSSDVCWGELNTIGFAADVTDLVSGNGVYLIADPVNGVVREDSNPSPVLPVTDGASLIVFYGGIGFDDQVVSDFTYSAESSGDNVRNLTGINSAGGAATLYLAGPDGQNNGGEEVRVTGFGVLNFNDSWNGSDPQEGADFAIGNLWDTDVHDVSSILPSGQTTLDINLGAGSDCTGLSAVALQVDR